MSGALAYSISDIEKVFLDVDDHDESLINLAMGLLADYVANHSSADCTHDAIQFGVLDQLKDMAAEWGIEVSHIYLTDLCDARAIRLLHDNQVRNPNPMSGNIIWIQ